MEHPATNGDATLNLKAYIVLIRPSQIHLIHFDLIDFIFANVAFSYSLHCSPHISNWTKDYYENGPTLNHHEVI